MKKMQEKGVTLIELIVVVVIIAIGALLLAPNIGAWLPNYRLRSATRDVASTMRAAQAKAVSNNTVYGVGFSSASECQLYRSSGGLTAEGAPVTLPDGVKFSNNTFPLNAALNKPFAQFNADYTSSTGSVTLKHEKKGIQKQITLTSATGRVKIE